MVSPESERAQNQASDEDLVALAVASGGHDGRPFEALVRRHQGHVVANCRAITRSPADAEDLAQEVLVKAFFALPRFEGRASFRGWIQRIKVNHCLNFLRKARTAGVAVEMDAAEAEGHSVLRVAPEAHDRLQAASDRERVLAVLDSLSDTLRIPLILRDADGLSYEEIADQLGIGLSAVKMRIKRGREEFRRSAGLTPVPLPPTSAPSEAG